MEKPKVGDTVEIRDYLLAQVTDVPEHDDLIIVCTEYDETKVFPESEITFNWTRALRAVREKHFGEQD